MLTKIFCVKFADGIVIEFENLPKEWINVFDNPNFKLQLDEFLKKQYLNKDVQQKLKKLDYISEWGGLN